MSDNTNTDFNATAVVVGPFPMPPPQPVQEPEEPVRQSAQVQFEDRIGKAKYDHRELGATDTMQLIDDLYMAVLRFEGAV